MTICLAVSDYWPEKLTMLPKITYELATRMCKYDDVTILSNEDNIHRKEFLISDNINVKYVKNIKKELIHIRYDTTHFFGSLLGLYDLISSCKFPIIHNLYTSKVNVDDLKYVRIGDFIKERRSWKCIDPISGGPILGNFIPDYFIRSHMRDSIIITQGKRYEKLYSEMIGNDSVYRIPHGINMNQFSSISDEDAVRCKIDLGFSEEDKIILYFGHSYLTRGLDDIIYSMKYVQKINKNFKLLMVLNDMPDSSSLNYIIKLAYDNLDSRSYKIIVKYVDRPELYYKLSDCVVLPYRFSLEIPEYPFVLLEAMASGKAVITSPIGSLPELIRDNYNGILTNPNPKTLPNEILRVVNDDYLNKRLGDNAKKSVREFDWELVTKKILDLYGGVQNGK